MEVTKAVTTEWPWPWHPDIHWYHPYLNLSSVGPEIWDALHLGVLTKFNIYNESNVAFKWVAQVNSNYTAINKLYREQYEGRDKNLTICVPFVMGVPYPDYYTRDFIFGCQNYVPESIAHFYHLKNIGYLYNIDKPMVDVYIGLGTAVTAIGVPGKYSFDWILGLVVYKHGNGTGSGTHTKCIHWPEVGTGSKCI